MFNKDKIGEGENAPVISAIYLYSGNNITHATPIDGDVKRNDPVKETTTVEGIKTETGYMMYTFSGTGAISLW